MATAATSSAALNRSAAFASDCAPHWGPEGFVTWRHYGTFWNNLVRWMTC